MTTENDVSDPGITGPLGRAVVGLARAVDELRDASRLTATRAEIGAALVAVTALAAQLTAVQLAMLTDAERAGVGDEVGAASTAVWWATQSRQTRTACRAASRLAAAVDPDTGTCRVVGDALGRGALVEEQARVIVAALADLPTDLAAEVRGHAEQVLVDLAAHHDAHDLRRLGRAVLEQVAPGVAEDHERRRLDEEERRAWQQVRFSMCADGHGLTHGRFTLPEVQGQMLRQMVMAFAQVRYRREHESSVPTPVSTDGSADERSEDHPLKLDRPAPQRMGEAFADLIERFDGDRLPTHGGVNPTVMVSMTLEQLTGHGDGAQAPVTLDTGTTLTAGQARRLACEAGLIPAVLGTGSVVLDMGRRSRFFTASQRHALALRDRGCTAAGCDLPPAMWHAHHDRPWSRGGRTDVEDGRLLCGRHHRLIHDAGFSHEIHADGRVRFTRRT